MELIQCKRDYTAFLIITIGIEFLGAFLHEKTFETKGQSETRFTNALGYFKNNWYTSNKKWLYENFRGPLIHQFRPGSDLLLTSISKNGATREEHLTLKDGKRLLVLEILFEDFQGAVNRLRNKLIRPNDLNKTKPTEDYIYKDKEGATGGTINNQSEEAKPDSQS